VVGIHNGRFANDDELFASHGLRRAHPEMTVDSAALFALLDAYPHRERDVLEALQGAMAAAWLDERHPHELGLARGLGRPLVIGVGSAGVFFASTASALNMLPEHLGLDLEIKEVPEGTFYSIAEGSILYEESFAGQLGDVPAATVDPPSPFERERCLSLLGPAFAPV
jgi:asparagine synthetase B (glutamine-hydrolysing)